jgi:hypothetical protein
MFPLAVNIAILSLYLADDPTASSKGDLRYAVSLTDEGATALGGPTVDGSNLALLQPSITYKQGNWLASSSVAALLDTYGAATHAQFQVREAYAGLSAGEFDFTAGRRLLRWGAGYAFSATGVLDPPRVATDPTDRLSLHEGRDLVQADWTHGGQSLTVAWASAALLTQNGQHDTTAIRYNFLSHGFDTSLIFAHDTGGTSIAGVNFSRVIGNSVEMHGEAAWRDAAVLLMGGKYTPASGFSFIAEYYSRPDTGYYRVADPQSVPGRQHYGFVRISKSRLRNVPAWKQWDVAAELAANFTDSSRIAVFDITRRFGTHFSGYTHIELRAGTKTNPQFGLYPYTSVVAVGVRCQL